MADQRSELGASEPRRSEGGGLRSETHNHRASDTGDWRPDAGCSILDAGYWILDTRWWLLDPGRKNEEKG